MTPGPPSLIFLESSGPRDLESSNLDLLVFPNSCLRKYLLHLTCRYPCISLESSGPLVLVPSNHPALVHSSPPSSIPHLSS